MWAKIRDGVVRCGTAIRNWWAKKIPPTKFTVMFVTVTTQIARFLVGINGIGLALSFSFVISILTSVTTSTMENICRSSFYSAHLMRIARSELNHFFLAGVACLLVSLLRWGIHSVYVAGFRGTEPASDAFRDDGQLHLFSNRAWLVIWFFFQFLVLLLSTVILTSPAIQFATDFYIPNFTAERLQTNWATYDACCMEMQTTCKTQ